MPPHLLSVLCPTHFGQERGQFITCEGSRTAKCIAVPVSEGFWLVEFKHQAIRVHPLQMNLTIVGEFDFHCRHSSLLQPNFHFNFQFEPSCRLKLD